MLQIRYFMLTRGPKFLDLWLSVSITHSLLSTIHCYHQLFLWKAFWEYDLQLLTINHVWLVHCYLGSDNVAGSACHKKHPHSMLIGNFNTKTRVWTHVETLPCYFHLLGKCCKLVVRQNGRKLKSSLIKLHLFFLKYRASRLVRVKYSNGTALKCQGY